MKVKEVEVTANIAWSPVPVTPIYLAAGTAAQQLDATFNTSSMLEIFSLNLTESGHGMPKVCSLPVESRFQKLVWGRGDKHSSGIIVGGFDRGQMVVYDADKLIKGQDEPVVFSKDKHTGPVSALDINPFQHNLLASGASESEIFIWDLNKHQTPMTPGAKSQPAEDVRCLAWNKQVQHILATTFSSRCVVWDLRKNDPIIKVSDSTSRMRCKVVAWHPDIATQMCIASEDDHTPIIQVWDLRLASSPLRTLERHHRGILGVSWCDSDSDLLLSCGKDNRILCWNPNVNVQGGEVQCELASSNQWSFDVSWCPRNPAVMATASFDGRVSVYSLMGGQQQVQPTTAIADSFPGMEGMQPPIAMAPASHGGGGQSVAVQLKTPPKWLKRPCGASFGFGGKIVTFGKAAAADGASEVRLGAVVTEPELVQRSVQLETSLKSGNLADFCKAKVDASGRDAEVWKFIGASCADNPRLELMDLLGYDPQKMGADAAAAAAGTPVVEASESAFDQIEAKGKPFDICSDASSPEGLLSRALLTGNLSLAVELCLVRERFADAFVLASHGGPELMAAARERYFAAAAESTRETPLIEAVVTGEWTAVAARCDPGRNWREVLAAALTYAYDRGGDEFTAICSRLGSRLAADGGSLEKAMLCYVCAGDLDSVVECWKATRGTKKNDHSPEELQDLVEVVTVLRSAKGGCSSSGGGGPMSTHLAEYAMLLASQGALEPALCYLGSIDDPTVSGLRERLQGALRQAAAAAAAAKPAARIARGGSLARNVAAPAGIALDQHQQQQRPGGWTHPSYTGIHNPAAEELSALSGPPVPHYDHGGITTRRESRPRNPSVEGPQPSFHPGAYVAAPAAMAPAPYEPYPATNIFTPSQQPLAPLQPANPIPATTSSGAGWNDPPPMAMTSKPRSNVTKTVQSNGAPPPITQPLMAMPGMEQQQLPPAGPPMYQSPPAQQAMPSSYHHQPPAQAMSSMNMGGGQPQPAPFQQQQQPYGGAMMNQPMHPMQQQQQPPIMGDHPTPVAAPMPQRSIQRQPEPPKPKDPIPDEHKVLQEVFDSLRNRCLTAATHPQIKRKLDDVGKKLEVLYDKLRENALPQETLSGLHQIKESIWSYDYNGCLFMVNQLVSTGSFSVLSQFISGVKVLIQVSQQLGVYLERR